MGFLDNYEGNKERTDRWIATYPEGRLEAHIVEFSAEKGYVLVQAKAWRNQTETHPAGIDYAYGYLAAYNANMKRWMIEDTTTSALMRVMALVMGGTEKATKETMQQVETMSTKVAIADVKKEYDYWTTKFGDVPSWDSQEAAQEAGLPTLGTAVSEIASQLGGELVAAAPECSHGHMIWKQAHEGAPKNWGGYFCTEKTKATQCTPRWYVFSSDGKWKPQV
jgi:hypothetical protein